MVLTKVAHNDAKSLNKIGCIFPHHLGGGGGQTLVWKIPQNLYFSYFVSFPIVILRENSKNFETYFQLDIFHNDTMRDYYEKLLF